ncbi:MAG: hypothetical protein JXP36_20460, partial [Bacteroidales bacterium]|nr:hypothetical protein [Bacteroidales bacterium]
LAAITPSDVIRERLNHYFSHPDSYRELSANSQQPTANSQEPIMPVFNVAYGQATSLFQLFDALQSNLANYDPKVNEVNVKIGPKREGDIPHSLASVDKIKAVLYYDPKYNAEDGFYAACNWYFENLK